MFHTPISTSAPHTYLSTLPFLPSRSPLSTTFGRNFTKAIKVKRGKLLLWPTSPLEWIGHTSGITCVGYSPNGHHIVTGSYDESIRIWDAETGSTVGEPLKGHSSSVTSVAYTPDGRHIISGSSDKTIWIWDAETGAAVGQPLEGHTDGVDSVACSSDGRHIISGSSDSTIRIWDAGTGAAVGQPLEGHTSGVLSVACSPNGQHTISGSNDATVRIWDAETGAAVGHLLEGYGHSVPSAPALLNRRRLVPEPGDDTTYMSDSPLHSISHPSIRISLSHSPLHPDFRTQPDPNGWVRDENNGLLYWVPLDCRSGLHSPALLTVPVFSHIRSVSLDFDNFAFGTSWTQTFSSPYP